MPVILSQGETIELTLMCLGLSPGVGEIPLSSDSSGLSSDSSCLYSSVHLNPTGLSLVECLKKKPMINSSRLRRC